MMAVGGDTDSSHVRRTNRREGKCIRPKFCASVSARFNIQVFMRDLRVAAGVMHLSRAGVAFDSWR